MNPVRSHDRNLKYKQKMKSNIVKINIIKMSEMRVDRDLLLSEMNTKPSNFHMVVPGETPT